MRLVGLMSGTSVDGIDAALVEISGGPRRWRWRLEAFVCVPWSPELRQTILDCCRPDAPVQTITALNYRLGAEFARAALEVAAQAGVRAEDVDAIASHGQTLWHQPTGLRLAGADATGTMQIGEPAVIAEKTGCLVIADFRAADMACGGQGAPLVPFADFALFRSAAETRAVLNLGGIANVTALPAGCSLAEVVAFDTGPGNMLLDALASKVSGGAMQRDEEGSLAERGRVDRVLLESWMDEPYFALPPPKSTGREMFGKVLAEKFYQEAGKRGLRPEDMLCTATALTVETIGMAFDRWLTPKAPVSTVIAGGGGVQNRALMRMLARRLEPARLRSHASFGLPDEAKEALAFALLGYETLQARPSNVPSATGARASTILGKIIFPPTFPAVWRLRLDKARRSGL